MTTITNNPVQDLRAWQKETQPSPSAKERAQDEALQAQSSDGAREAADTVEIQNAARYANELAPTGDDIKTSDEAQRSVNEVIRLMDSETEKSSGEDLHDISPGQLVDLLA